MLGSQLLLSPSQPSASALPQSRLQRTNPTSTASTRGLDYDDLSHLSVSTTPPYRPLLLLSAPARLQLHRAVAHSLHLLRLLSATGHSGHRLAEPVQASARRSTKVSAAHPCPTYHLHCRETSAATPSSPDPLSLLYRCGVSDASTRIQVACRIRPSKANGPSTEPMSARSHTPLLPPLCHLLLSH